MAAPELLTLDEHDVGISWVVDEAMQRASHALRDDEGRVWLVDPVDVPEAVERAGALGEVAGVLQLLDRHPRACADLASRFGVPHHRLPDALPGTPFALFDVVSVPRWREKGLWWAGRQALVVPEAIGTHPMFSGERPAGVHVLLRFLPPRGLRRYEPQHLLTGHGPPLHGADAAGAVRDAVARSVRDLPGVLARLPRYSL